MTSSRSAATPGAKFSDEFTCTSFATIPPLVESFTMLITNDCRGLSGRAVVGHAVPVRADDLPREAVGEHRHVGGVGAGEHQDDVVDAERGQLEQLLGHLLVAAAD